MIEIYTDGSCLENPGNGGWAAIINDDGKIEKISGREKNTTNNRMELMAPIAALIKNNWQTSKKEDVKNKDLWLNLYKLTQSHDVEWHWVKAHAGNTLNEEVDALAKDAAKSN